MKPYLFNYSEKLEIIELCHSSILQSGTRQTFTIEHSDADLYNVDITMQTKEIENSDNDASNYMGTIVTATLENSDHDHLVSDTSETRMLESSDHESAIFFTQQ